MPRRALRCVVDLDVLRVSAPGVWLPSREDCYISISIFGQYRNTRNVTSVFPLLLHEPFRFEKTYYTALDPSDVAEFLDDELVVLELLQYSDYSAGAVRLASYSCSAREFLFPYPSLCPSYTSTSREALFSRTIAFPGISPKLEFCTKTVIKDSRSPELDALEDALEEEKLARRTRSRSRSCSRARSRSMSRSRSLSRGRRSYSSDSDEGWESDGPRYMRPTIASIFRSRSKSALEKSLIGRTPGAGPQKPQKLTKKSKKSSSRPSSALSGYVGGKSKACCPVCSTIREVYVSEMKCVVCQAYRRHMGKPYWGHGPNFHPTGQPCCYHRNGKVIRDSTGSIPVYSTKYVSDDDEDAEVAALTTSRSYASLSPRPRSASPYIYKSPYSSRFGLSPRPFTASEEVELAIARAKVRARARALSPVPRRYTPMSSLRSSLDDLEIDTKIVKCRQYYPHIVD